MEEKEWREMLNRWFSSKKHKELKERINVVKSYTMSDKQIVDLHNSTIEFFHLPQKEKEEYDILDELMAPSERFEHFIKFCMQMSFFEIRSVRKEAYELAQKIKEIKLMEAYDINRVITTYHPNFLIEEGVIESILHYSFEEVKKNYDEWDELIKKKEDE